MSKGISTVGGLAAAILVASTALAADLPFRKGPPALLPPPPPPPMWTGFYVGVNAGYVGGLSTTAGTISAPLLDGIADAANFLDPKRQLAGTGLAWGGTALANTGVANINQSGFIGGGQIGYNFQLGSSFIVGVEADIQGTTMSGRGRYAGASQDVIGWKDTSDAPCFVTGCLFTRTAQGVGSISASTDWLGTVRGRLGFLVTPTLMVYGTGGFAYGGVTASATHLSSTTGTLVGANDALFPTPFPYSVLNGTYTILSSAGAANFSSTRTGWTAGGGFEWMFWPNWSFKAEGLYYDLGSVNLQATAVSLTSPVTIALGGINVFSGQLLVANAPITRVRLDGVMGRAGVNYHFNWGAPAPVVARY